MNITSIWEGVGPSRPEKLLATFNYLQVVAFRAREVFPPGRLCDEDSGRGPNDDV
jgi:hypothetical protein